MRAGTNLAGELHHTPAGFRPRSRRLHESQPVPAHALVESLYAKGVDAGTSLALVAQKLPVALVFRFVSAQP